MEQKIFGWILSDFGL